jgi:betaine-aldehyde dehydrogenase
MAFDARHVYYDGKVQISHGDVFQTTDPSTGNHLANVHSASLADIDSAIASASRAFRPWASTPPIERSRILLRVVRLLRERNDEIAGIETADTGKPFSETSTVDVVTGADVAEYFAGLVASGGLNGETAQLREDVWVYTKKEPLGVCAGIGAWNYPIQMSVNLFPLSESFLTESPEHCGSRHHV